MYNFVSNNKSGASKWMDPSSEQNEESKQQPKDTQNQKKLVQREKSGFQNSGPIKVIHSELTSKLDCPTSTVGKINGCNSKSKPFELNISPKRLALAFDIPTIIIEYLVPNTGKLYHHKIKIRELNGDSDLDKCLIQLKRRHEMYLTCIPDRQILKLLTVLRNQLRSIQCKQKENLSVDNQPKKRISKRLSSEEDELCSKLKNQFADEEEEEQNEKISSDDYDYDFEDYSEQEEKKITNKSQKTLGNKVTNCTEKIKEKSSSKDAQTHFDDGLEFLDQGQDKDEEDAQEEEDDDEGKNTDFDYDAKAVFLSKFTKNEQEEEDEYEEGEEEDEEEEEQEGEDDYDYDLDENQEAESGEKTKKQPKQEEGRQNNANKLYQELDPKKNDKQKMSSVGQNIPIFSEVIPKKNNYLDADEAFDLPDQFQMDLANLKVRHDQEEEDDDDDDEQEDIYQKVKRQLGVIQQKESISKKAESVSDYKQNLQQKKYQIQYYERQALNQLEGKKQDKEGDEDEEEFEEEDEEEEEEEQNGEEQDQSEDDQDEDDDQKEPYELEDEEESFDKYKLNNRNGEQKGKDINKGRNKSMLEELEEENMINYDSFDLNKLAPQEVEQHKKKMDIQFEKNRKKPQDIGFVYDVREHFDPDESNQWDNSQIHDKHEMEYDFV